MMNQLTDNNDAAKNTVKNGYDAMISVAETVINGFFTVNDSWTVTVWNKAAEVLLGVDAKNIIGCSFWKAFSGKRLLNFLSAYQQFSLREMPSHFKEYYSGTQCWFDIITYYYSNTLSVSFKCSAHRTVRHHEGELEVINESYRFVTEVTNECLWEWNIRGHDLFWIDGGHKRLFGYNIVNTLVPPGFWEQCLHPEDRARVRNSLYRFFSSGSQDVWEAEYRFKKTDSTYAFVHDRGRIIYEHGTAVRMVGAIQDVTARRQAELKLFESERKLSLIARQTVNAVIITDALENIIWVNEAFSTITGYMAQEVAGRKPGDFLRGAETNPLTVAYLREKMKNLELFDCEIINYKKTGEKYWVHIQGQPMLDDKGNCESFFAIGTDISERKMFEIKLMEDRVKNQLEITEAVLAAQEQERSDIGKELHDNVNQILGATKLYIEMAKTDDKKKDVFLDEASGHLQDSIEAIRKISKKLVPHSISLIGLGNSIRILVDDLLRIHPIQIQFTGQNAGTEDLDEKMQLNIFRIVQEQINNVLKHSEASLAGITLLRNKTGICLRIADNGKGCEMEGQNKGVGLRNILSRVELYKGTMSIQSMPGQGYELSVLLPLESTPE